MSEAVCGNLSSQALRILDNLLRRRVVMLLGKGGVGRTRATATLAKIATQRGLRTLVMETDQRRPLAAAYGKKTSYAPQELAPKLFAMLLDRQKSLEEYLSFSLARPALEALFASSLYQHFVQAAPGLRELMMMGKIYNEIERRPANTPSWDLILVDMPASGHALNMLNMPFAAVETFGRNLVGDEADEVARFLRNDEKCAFVVVTLAEPLAMIEAAEIDRKLASLRLRTACVICNKTITADYGDAELDELRTRGQALKLSHVDLLTTLARADLKRRQREQAALTKLRRQIGAVLCLPEAGMTPSSEEFAG